VCRNEDEVSRTRLDRVLEMVAPPVSGDTFHHVEDCLLIPVVVRTGRGAGLHGGEEGAQYFGVGVAAVEGDVPAQSRGLGGVIGELVAPNDADRKGCTSAFPFYLWPTGRALSPVTCSPNGGCSPTRQVPSTCRR
jgi:hypothetical protein